MLKNTTIGESGTAPLIKKADPEPIRMKERFVSRCNHESPFVSRREGSLDDIHFNTKFKQTGSLCQTRCPGEQGNADFQIGKHELYSKPTRKPGNTVLASLTRRVTKLRSFKN
jgi:hypothetical protein